jgi:hypothetical protein
MKLVIEIECSDNKVRREAFEQAAMTAVKFLAGRYTEPYLLDHRGVRVPISLSLGSIDGFATVKFDGVKWSIAIEPVVHKADDGTEHSPMYR